MSGLFMGFGAGNREHLVAAGIKRRCDPLDVAALAGRVPSFIGYDDRNLFAVEFIVQIPELSLQTVQLLLVFII